MECYGKVTQLPPLEGSSTGTASASLDHRSYYVAITKTSSFGLFFHILTRLS